MKMLQNLLAMKSFDLLIDKVRRISFDVAYQARKRRVRFHTDENVHMVGHAVDCNKFIALILNDPGRVFVQSFLPRWHDEHITMLDGVNNMNIDLGVCVCHCVVQLLWS